MTAWEAMRAKLHDRSAATAGQPAGTGGVMWIEGGREDIVRRMMAGLLEPADMAEVLEGLDPIADNIVVMALGGGPDAAYGLAGQMLTAGMLLQQELDRRG